MKEPSDQVKADLVKLITERLDKETGFRGTIDYYPVNDSWVAVVNVYRGRKRIANYDLTWSQESGWEITHAWGGEGC